MPEERNKAVVRRFYEEVFDSGRLEVIDELASPEVVAHDALPSGVPERVPEPYKHTVEMFRSDFPNLHQDIEDLVAEGDTVSVRVAMTATHLGPSWAWSRLAEGAMLLFGQETYGQGSAGGRQVP